MIFTVPKTFDDKVTLQYGRTWINNRKNGLSKDKNAAFSRKQKNKTVYFEEELINYQRVFSFLFLPSTKMILCQTLFISDILHK